MLHRTLETRCWGYRSATRTSWRRRSGCAIWVARARASTPRTYALVKIAALIALDAPPTSYAWQIANALDEGVTPEDVLGVLRAVAFQVGAPKVVAAAPEIMLALGLTLPEEG